MKRPFFSILVVALNPGEKLLFTMRSIAAQTCTDYEVIIKDGGSKDGSGEKLKEYLQRHPETEQRVRCYTGSDSGIYDAMNQAASYAEGEFFCFLNCGDGFHDGNVLEMCRKAVEEDRSAGLEHKIYYGNIQDMLQHTEVASNPHMDAFACYRNVPCHQACFYEASLFAERGYKTQYKVRGDYEHFLWCFFKKQASPRYIPMVVADYEGGGFSETKENLRRSKDEHREITAMYMSSGQRLKYRLMLMLSLAPLRTRMAHSKYFSGFYNRIKMRLYGKKKD